ncbi:MAG: ABC transporter ATP-binding protein [Hyphomicrobiaceae bacterium]|nr:ABC transporter ATP-binding protein [Hyphomicrobiaceae bacterium]
MSASVETKSTDGLIEVADLRLWYPVRRGFLASLLGLGEDRHLKAVDGVSFAIKQGEVLGLAGESGCGKSTTGMTVMRLLKPTAGTISFGGTDVASFQSSAELKSFRRNVQIVFQNPYEALNPRFTVYESVREPVAVHFPGDRDLQHEKIVRALERAGLAPPETYFDRYPHQLSGGQLQRIAIARAIAIEPKLLVADEPVSMLDVSIRAGILNLFRSFSRDLGMSILYISHDLSTMRHVCQRVAIMYLGKIVEIGTADEVLVSPRHPYTQALVAAVPLMGGAARERVQLEGAVPNPIDLPAGCRFHPRCSKAFAPCSTTEPRVVQEPEGRRTMCHLVDPERTG